MPRLIRYRWLVVGLLLSALLVGCTSPEVKKQRFFKSGMQYYQEGKYPEAIIQFSNAIQVDHDFVDARYQLAQCYLRQSAFSSAYNELRRVLEIQPKHWKAHVDMGNLLLGARQMDQAKEHADLVLDNNPDDIDARVLLADVLAAMDQPDIALREMQKAISVDPNRSTTWLNQAYLLARLKPAEAEASFQKAISRDPQSRQAVMALGDFYQRQKRWNDSEAQYRRALELLPKDQEPRHAMADLFIAKGDFPRAEQVLIEAKAVAPNDPAAYRMLGDCLVSAGQFDRAVFEFASLHRTHPNDLRITKNYISLLILKRRLLEAAALNDKVLKDNAKDREAQTYRAHIWIYQGRTNEAMDLLDKILKDDPQNGRAHYLSGVALMQLGNVPRAEIEWREALRLRPDLVEARQSLAASAIRRGNTQLLGDMIDQLIQAEPMNPKWYVYRAATEMATDQRDKAEADFLKAISVAPHDPLGYTSMGNLRFSQGKLADAEKYYEQALEQDANFVDALQGLMAVAMQQKQVDKALARVDQQIRRAAGNSSYFTLRGTLRMSKGDLDGAAADFAHATELNKNNVDAFALLGQVFAVRGSLPQAISSYERSIQSNPNDVRSYVLLGSLEYSRGNFQRAHDMYEKALRLEPDYPLAANNLAYLMLERGENVDVAASLAQVARRGMPDEPTAADTLGWAYYKKDAYNLAIDLFKEALTSAPNNPTYHYHLGLAYQGAHLRDQAREHLRKVLELNPNDSHAQEIEQALRKLERG